MYSITKQNADHAGSDHLLVAGGNTNVHNPLWKPMC